METPHCVISRYRHTGDIAGISLGQDILSAKKGFRYMGNSLDLSITNGNFRPNASERNPAADGAGAEGAGGTGPRYGIPVYPKAKVGTGHAEMVHVGAGAVCWLTPDA